MRQEARLGGPGPCEDRARTPGAEEARQGPGSAGVFRVDLRGDEWERLGEEALSRGSPQVGHVGEELPGGVGRGLEPVLEEAVRQGVRQGERWTRDEDAGLAGREGLREAERDDVFEPRLAPRRRRADAREAPVELEHPRAGVDERPVLVVVGRGRGDDDPDGGEGGDETRGVGVGHEEVGVDRGARGGVRDARGAERGVFEQDDPDPRRGGDPPGEPCEGEELSGDERRLAVGREGFERRRGSEGGFEERRARGVDGAREEPQPAGGLDRRGAVDGRAAEGAGVAEGERDDPLEAGCRPNALGPGAHAARRTVEAGRSHRGRGYRRCARSRC